MILLNHMKNKNLITHFLILVIVVLVGIVITKNTSAVSAPVPAVTNHLKMTMENISKISSTKYQFDLFVTSDGSATSDVRLANIQYGINFNPALVPAGATKSVSYVGGSELKPARSFNFPAASSASHLRIVQTQLITSNTNIRMPIGSKVKVGTFMLTSSLPFTAADPGFSLQDATKTGFTPTVANVWIGSTPVQVSFFTSGTGNGQRTLQVIKQ